MAATTPQSWAPELEGRRWDEVLAGQAERLPRTIAHARRRSAFYARHLGDIDAAAIATPQALRRLPFTTKAQLRAAQADANPDRPLGANQAVARGDLVQLLSSSGTTGRPMFYGLTAADRDAWADGIGGMFFTLGLRAEDTIAHVVALPMVAGGLAYADGMRRVGATLAWLGGFPPERILQSILQVGATAMLATVSFALYLTERCEELVGVGPAQLGIRKLFVGGEPGLAQPEIRERIRAAWQVDVLRECMGLGDVMAGMWAECEAEDGMHFVAARHVLVELVDPDGGEAVAWEEGAGGELVYTTLDREATPVVRYRSGDRATVAGTTCACGRRTPRVRIVGRTDDMLIYKGMNVFPTSIRDVALGAAGDAITHHLRVRKATADQVQFLDPIPVELEAGAGLASDQYARVERTVEAAVRQHLQVRVAVEVRPPGSLPPGPYKTSLAYVAGEEPR